MIQCIQGYFCKTRGGAFTYCIKTHRIDGLTLPAKETFLFFTPATQMCYCHAQNNINTAISAVVISRKIVLGFFLSSLLSIQAYYCAKQFRQNSMAEILVCPPDYRAVWKIPRYIIQRMIDILAQIYYFDMLYIIVVTSSDKRQCHTELPTSQEYMSLNYWQHMIQRKM